MISGRITDGAGLPIGHVRVLARPAGSTSDAVSHVAISNDQGVYRLPVGAYGVFVISVLRIGFRPDSALTVSVDAGNTQFNIVMRSLPFLATVKIMPHEVRCLPLDDPGQSLDVRDWIHSAQAMIHARRALEKEYTYQVTERWTFHDHNGHEQTQVRTVTQEAGDTMRIHLEEENAAAATGKLLANGSIMWPEPNEATVLSPTFAKRVCFDNQLLTTSDGQHEVRFKQIDARPSELYLRGTFRFAENALMTEITLTLGRLNALGGSQFVLSYTNLQVDGESFPVLIRDRSPGSDRRYAYTAWVRAK